MESDSEDESKKKMETVEVIDLNENFEYENLVAEFGDIGMDDEYEDIEETNIDNSIYTIDNHTGGVFTIDIYKSYLASGSEDEFAYIWELDEENGVKMYFKSEKFKDSVTNVKFSTDGKFLVVADLSGFIRVYDVNKKSEYWSYDVGFDIETAIWHPNCNVLFAGTSNGNVWMFKLSTNEIKMMSIGDSMVRVNAMKILKNGLHAACVYSNGNCAIWELKTSKILYNFKKLQTFEILCMDLNPDGNLLACGGFDMKLSIISTNNGKLLTELNMKDNEEDDCIESIEFCPLLPICACASLNGEIFVWDLQTYTLRNKIAEYTNGFTKLLWYNSYNLLVASLDGCVFEYDGRNLEFKRKLGYHNAKILDFCLDSNFKYLFTASDDKKIKIFNISANK